MSAMVEGTKTMRTMVASTMTAVAKPTPTIFTPRSSLATKPIKTLELNMSGMSFTIDGKTFDHERVDQHLTMGDIEEWIITNPSMMDHPFHIHVWQFQVTEASDQGLVSPGLKDTVVVPAGGWVKFVLHITDFPGKAVYHCHILDHEDQGMMGIFEATA